MQLELSKVKSPMSLKNIQVQRLMRRERENIQAFKARDKVDKKFDKPKESTHELLDGLFYDRSEDNTQANVNRREIESIISAVDAKNSSVGMSKGAVGQSLDVHFAAGSVGEAKGDGSYR